MTELQFTQNGEFYECQTTVNADFNLHLEMMQEKPLVVEMSTVEDGQYKTIYHDRTMLVDEDFDALVFPKYLHIRTWSMPTKAILTEAE